MSTSYTDAIRTSARATRFPSVEELSDNLYATIKAAEPEPEPEPAKPSPRAITRFLGLGRLRGDAPVPEPAAPEPEQAEDAAPLPVASLVILDGPGRGQGFFVTGPVCAIGRGEGQDIQLNFGDSYISRQGHARILQDTAAGGFVLEDGGKANPVLLNGTAIRGQRDLQNGDRVTVGGTTLRFHALAE